jgi:hypothetical protein
VHPDDQVPALFVIIAGVTQSFIAKLFIVFSASRDMHGNKTVHVYMAGTTAFSACIIRDYAPSAAGRACF